MKYIIRSINIILLFFIANAYSLILLSGITPAPVYIAASFFFIIINFKPSFYSKHLQTRRLHICADGCELLLLFLFSAAMSVVWIFYIVFGDLQGKTLILIFGILNAVVCEAVIFWNGIIRVYCTSVQLGIRWRIIGIIFGWIPVANLYALYRIIRIASEEVSFENNKIIIDDKRKKEQLCHTRYPLLLVHGVFFRDFKYFNYWGRIPEELKRNGAEIYYGNHQSAASVAESAKELTDRIHEIVKQTGCEKVNIIAHSKGGLDCRYALCCFGADQYVASLTTINTPHRGCLFADYLLDKIPEKTRNFIAQKYNSTLKKFGESSPDFLAAVNDLTAAACEEFNNKVKDCPEVFCQSVGSKLNQAINGRFPLNFSYPLVKYFDGANDGLVSVNSSIWGQKNILLSVNGRRGISHGDVIDLNRENIKNFDVREFYVKLVNDLKKQGL